MKPLRPSSGAIAQIQYSRARRNVFVEELECGDAQSLGGLFRQALYLPWRCFDVND